MLPPSFAGRPEFIPISTLVRASACPVRVYLERHDPILEPYEYTVAKQVGYHLGDTLDADAIWREITLVRPDTPISMQEYLRGCVSVCAGLSWRLPRTVDLTITNRRYAVSGRIDWFFDTEPKIGILRATRAPDHGVWRQDRLRAAGYLLAAEELADETVSEVQIAYLPSGIVRRVVPNASDRRTLLSVLKSVEAIHRGETPRPPPNAPCDRCGKKDLCNKEPPTLFERFFKR
ncbi:CRISPR/Cas system-associated exonuclease Cas4 (RecB family) [Methanocalculus alkaliphilus]|uniref:PD-(D/E)XK nuclease family protein n=1 Tax=Methanocalculus alkaliphilus TaxID=768730 RepID=UPI00209D6E2B|nr:PD-(D/E)XK nuclease family protein [Methanocalculus alkaliphilus]MCP1714996.1 CRISPR/Cas system-associated exonuclease Cas4 (RecB family) [Methanocalculus alkaliphilus]